MVKQKLLIAHRLDRLSRLLKGFEPKQDNLHRIAISNIEDNFEASAARWWERKFRQPLKAYEDHTIEELAIKMFEDFYDRNPNEIEKFKKGEVVEDEWDGTIDPEHEARVKEKLRKIDERNRVDIRRYQSEKELSEEEERKILESVGKKKLSPSSPTIGEDEFEDEFGG